MCDMPMPISHPQSPTASWVATSAFAWPPVNPKGDSVNLDEVLRTVEDDGVQNIDQFFACNDGMAQAPAALGRFEDGLLSPLPPFCGDGLHSVMELEAMHQGATCGTEFADQCLGKPVWTALEDVDPLPTAAWNGGVAQAPDAVHPRRARGGGNMVQRKESGRVFHVPRNKDGVLLYQPKASYERDIETLKQYIDALPSEAKKRGGVEHPLLHVREVRMHMAVSNAIDKKIYGHRRGNKAFAQLLCYLGMRSSIDKKANVRTLAFDPDGWNRTGYRLIKGGDVKGGKPTIVPV